MTVMECKGRTKRAPSAAVSVRLVLLLATTAWSGARCLRLTKLSVPPYRLRGDIAKLECAHELEGDRLYSVKWYKDNEEFYRYVPRASPAQHSYRVDGVRVDHHLSDSMQVYLRSLTLRSSGVYRCEVSAEAPSFSSASGEGRMEVIFPPKEPPRISGGKNTYERNNDLVDLNCTAGRSHPAATLRWYVNDRPADPDWLIPRDPIPHGIHGLASAVLGLRFRVNPGQFLEPGPGGGGGGGGDPSSPERKTDIRHGGGRVIRLRCVATISPLSWEGEPRAQDGGSEREEEGIASPALSRVIDRRETLFLVRAASAALAPSLPLLIVSWLSAVASADILSSLHRRRPSSLS